MPPKALALHRAYSRREIHGLFSPGTPFTPQAGTWGLHGIIRLRDRPNDFVLIVTLGQTQGEHTFDEGISTEGILRWQTQPRQGLDDKAVQALIEHDEDRHSVYLFLRTASGARNNPTSYTFLGHLKYAGHDVEREKPVHFAWQLLSWPIPEVVLERMGLTLEAEDAGPGRAAERLSEAAAEERRPGSLIEEPPPRQRVERGESTRSFRANKRRRQPEQEDRALGLVGEHLVLAWEQRRLTDAGRPDLATRVVHTAVIEGDGAGFDIASFFPDGRPKYVEVKTTTGPREADFFISANEVAFAASHADSYELCRVFDYDRASNSGRFYAIPGSRFGSLILTPIQFRVGQLTST